MSATFIPAQTEVRVVAPEKVVIELTLKEAARLRALLGQSTGNTLIRLWRDLSDLADAGRIERLRIPDPDTFSEDCVEPEGPSV